MKLINLDGSPNINLISHPLAFLRAQAAAATAGRQSPETVDVKGGGVSFRRQQSESGGDGTNAETNPEILGKVYIYVHEISADGANQVDANSRHWNGSAREGGRVGRLGLPRQRARRGVLLLLLIPLSGTALRRRVRLVHPPEVLARDHLARRHRRLLLRPRRPP